MGCVPEEAGLVPLPMLQLAECDTVWADSPWAAFETDVIGADMVPVKNIHLLPSHGHIGISLTKPLTMVSPQHSGRREKVS